MQYLHLDITRLNVLLKLFKSMFINNNISFIDPLVLKYFKISTSSKVGSLSTIVQTYKPRYWCRLGIIQFNKLNIVKLFQVFTTQFLTIDNSYHLLTDGAPLIEITLSNVYYICKQHIILMLGGYKLN